mmetsp:Transcript_21968/g.40099  ORF Transcript_21968/g.40099 Transcript_21968/m.40099 type:complete len:87 (-) Transcript_21968:1602-1862(-)
MFRSSVSKSFPSTNLQEKQLSIEVITNGSTMKHKTQMQHRTLPLKDFTSLKALMNSHTNTTARTRAKGRAEAITLLMKNASSEESK